jgi:hypothetical protein
MTADEAISKAAIAYLPTTYRRILQQLAVEPLDSQGIADYLGMTIGATYKLVMILKGLKVICVTEYRREAIKGAPIKLWGLGSRDVRPPPKIEPAARSKAWRERRGQKPKMGVFMKWATQGEMR